VLQLVFVKQREKREVRKMKTIDRVYTIRKQNISYVPCPLCGQLTEEKRLSSGPNGNLIFKCKKCNHLIEMRSK
jgi:ribosomal protein L37AE/L43A